MKALGKFLFSKIPLFFSHKTENFCLKFQPPFFKSDKANNICINNNCSVGWKTVPLKAS